MTESADHPLHTSRAMQSPPAIWAAFARQGAWKSWVLVFQLFLISLLALANIRLSQKPPDIVVIAPDGKSTYLTPSIAGDAIVRFLADQKQQPSDLTVLHFTREFLNLMLAVNSSTIEAAWPRCLSMMSRPLRVRMAKESADQKLIETYKLAHVRTELKILDITLVERADQLFHLRARVSRIKSRIVDGASPARDELEIDMVERGVYRTIDKPDGLELADFNVRAISGDTGVKGAKNAAGLPEAGDAP